MEVGAESRVGMTDLYTIDVVTGTFTQLTFDGDNDSPVWAPDGKTIAFAKNGDDARRLIEEIMLKPADNGGPERRLTSDAAPNVNLEQWFGGTQLLFSATTAGTGEGIFTRSVAAGDASVEYASTPFREIDPRLSPDGKLIAYVSNETGSNQLWLRDFPVPQGKWNLSRANARAPRWTPDGKAVLFWRAGSPVDSLFRVRLGRAPGVVVQDPELVVAMNMDGLTNWDLHPDGRRFVVAVPSAAAAPAGGAARPGRYLIVENWFRDLERLAPVGR
jgi:Tol biopolymer transport system component